MTFWRGVQECSAVVAPQARDYRTKAIIARARSRAAPLYTSGRPVAGILQRRQQTAAAARTFSPRGEVPRARVRLRRARIQSMPTRNACADDISHIHVADARHIFMGRTSAPWAPLRYAPRRQPTHPPSSEPAGAQGVLGRFGTWCPRVFPVVASTIPQFRARPAHVRCLSRLFATPVGGADRCKTRRCTAIDSSALRRRSQ